MGFPYFGQPAIFGEPFGMDSGGAAQTLADYLAELNSYSPLALWDAGAGLFSDAGTTPVVADGAVQQWNDQSGNGHHVTQATASAKPAYRAAPSGFNGRPAVQFDGGDHLERTVAAGLAANLNAYTIISVFACTNLGSLQHIYGEGSNATGTPLVGSRVSSSGGFHAAHRSDANAQTAPDSGPLDAANGAMYLHTFRRIASNSWAVRADGEQVATASDTVGTTTVNRIALGALVRTTVSFNLTGHIAHVSVWPSDIYATIEPIIAGWYGIALP